MKQLIKNIFELIHVYFRNKRIMKMQAGGMTYQAIGDKVRVDKGQGSHDCERHEEEEEG